MRKAFVGVVLLLSLLSAQRAEAQARFGVRTGLTDDPDSFFFGGHLAFHPERVRNLRIEPSMELGLGEEDFDGLDFLSLRFNLHFKYAIPVSREAAFFPVLGPSIYYQSFDNCQGDCTDTEVGLDLGFGFAYEGFSFELIFGASGDNDRFFDDFPDLTFTFTYTF